METAALLGKFISILTSAGGYNTGAPADISLTALNGLLSDLKSRNESVFNLDGDLTTERKARLALYDGPTGLH